VHLAVDGYGLTRPLAGMGTYTREILGALAAARPQHRLTAFLPAGADPPVEGGRVAYRRLPDARFLGRHLQLPRQVRRSRADVFFTPAGHLPLTAVGVPAAVTVHDLAIYRRPDWFPGGQQLSVRVIVPRSLRRADALIAVSEHTRRDLAELFDVAPDRVAVAHHGVSPRYRPLPVADLQEVRRRLRLPERYVLFVGTIEPRKNVLTLLDAWAMLKQRPPLVIAGGWGWRCDAERQRLARLGEGAHVLGDVSPADLPAVYNLAACLAHPAWYEGFGMTVLEAMACGTPVICSDAASLPEVTGDAAVTLAPGDADAWRAALEGVLHEPGLSADLRRAGILRAAGFTWERSAERTWAALEALVS
jgi:glycosyltransferase involved in cell wall biosynthesis